MSGIGKNLYLCRRILNKGVRPNIHHSLFPAVKRGNLNGKQAGRLNFVHRLCGVGLTVSGYSTTWLPQIVPRTFLRYFATFVIATRVRPHTRGLFNKESKRQKFDWETGGTGRTSCYHGAGFGCLFRGSLPCLIPFSRSPRFSFFSLIRRMTVKLLWIISLSVQIKCYSHGWSVCCFR